MSLLSVRNIVLTSLVNSIALEDIVGKIRDSRPESKAGLKEIKWYISKMKKEGFLDSNGSATEKGKKFVSNIQFRTSKTLKPVSHETTEKSKFEELNELLEYATSQNDNAKLRDAALKNICKELTIPYEKKGENKAARIVRVKFQLSRFGGNTFDQSK